MTALIFAGGEPNQAQVRLLVTWLLAIMVLLMVGYLALHWILPPSEEGFFFWNEAPAQWLDWLFWSGTGVFLHLSSTLAARSVDPDRSVGRFPPTVRGCFIEMLKGLVVALIVLWVAVNVVDVDLLGLKIRLKEAPAIAVLLGFVLGFYTRVARELFKLALQFFKRYVERTLSHSIGDTTDDKAYVELHVDPRLQAAYRLAASTESGRSDHEASRDRRAGYKVSNIVSRAGFTVNALRTVFIARDLMTSSPKETIVEILAHEASHVEQGFWSDSLEQEVQAFVRAAEVMEELKENRKVKRGDEGGWLPPPRTKEEQKAAENKVLSMQSNAPLYGMIPRKQKTGWADDKREMVRQAVCLGLYMLRLSRRCIIDREKEEEKEGGSE